MIILIIIINDNINNNKHNEKYNNNTTLFNEDAYLTITNLPQGPQKHKTNTRITIIRRKIQEHYNIT